MNWDWDKLQEKRQRQGKNPIPQGDGPENPFKGPQLGKYIPRFSSGLPVFLVAGAAILFWLASGFFIVNPGETGVVLRFGKFIRQVDAGPHYHLPSPIEAKFVINTNQPRIAVIGRPSELSTGSGDESHMFTGDENIVHMHFSVQYIVADVNQFLFNVKSPDALVANASEAAMREVVGSGKIDDILTEKRALIEQEVQSSLQHILDTYQSGIHVTAVQLRDVAAPAEVRDAFADFASAREDKERIINQAQAYYNEIVPVATGTAQSMVYAAEAYREQVVLAAEGETARFLAMLAEYHRAEAVTRKRLYLEAMQDVLSSPAMQKIVLSKYTQNHVLPLLQLETPTRPATPAAPAQRGGQ